MLFLMQTLLKKKSNIFLKNHFIALELRTLMSKVKSKPEKSSPASSSDKKSDYSIDYLLFAFFVKPFKKKIKRLISPQPSPSPTVARHQGEDYNAIGFLKRLC